MRSFNSLESDRELNSEKKEVASTHAWNTLQVIIELFI